MQFDAAQRRQALKDFIAQTGLRVARWEKEAGLGDGTLRKFLDGVSNTLTDRTLQRLATAGRALLGRDVSVGELLAEPAQTSFLPPPPAPRRGFAEAPTLPPSDKPDIPVWASAAAGDGDGSIILTETPIDWIKRSERTLTVANPWAFHIVGDSMLERLAQGDQAVVNPAMPLLPLTDCVFVRQGEDGTMYALVKRLLRANSDVWRVRQLNPERDFELSRKKWPKAYRIAEIRPRM